jgi:hypothetical protein
MGIIDALNYGENLNYAMHYAHDEDLFEMLVHGWLGAF